MARLRPEHHRLLGNGHCSADLFAGGEIRWGLVEARVIHQATGVLMVYRRTSITEAAALLTTSAEMLGVDRAALSRLVIDSLNARAVGR
jgi:hypothetical protein